MESGSFPFIVQVNNQAVSSEPSNQFYNLNDMNIMYPHNINQINDSNFNNLLTYSNNKGVSNENLANNKLLSYLSNKDHSKDNIIMKKIRNIFHDNVRSIANKKSTLKEIFEVNDVDIGFISELNTQSAPRFKGYQQFCLYSNIS